MAKAKKITVASITKAMGVNKKDKETLVIGDGDDRISIVVKKRLNLVERSNMVNSIVSMVWAQDENDEERFAPYLRKFAYDFNILNYFTNITLPDDMNSVWELVDGTDIAMMIADFVGRGYIDNIIREANEAIEYRKSENLKRSKFDTILDSLAGLMQSVEKQTNDMNIKDLFELVGANAPELKEELEILLKTQTADMPSDTPVAPVG